MAGILNSKERIFDTILTTEGRKQMAQGTLRAEFVSFTDGGTIYAIDTIISGGGMDVTDRIQLEATNLPQDTVAIEADDSGKLTGFPASGSTRFIIRSGQILSSSSENETVTVTGSQFSSLSNILLSSSIDNFKKLYILQSPDPIDNREKSFLVGPKEKQFEITKTRPFNTGSITSVRVDHVESFFQDKRLSHLPNYLFLPPVNRARVGSDIREPLGEFVNLNQEPILTFEDVMTEMSGFENQGYAETFRFTETSKESNVFGQFFELSAGEMIKLDVIDFGSFISQNGVSKHVFFAGKIFEDGMGSHTYVNMFTLIFE
jgi:hypothetical protein